MQKRETMAGRERLKALLAVLVLCALVLAAFQVRPARSAVCLCVCAFPEAFVTMGIIKAEHIKTRQHFGTTMPITSTPGALSPLGTGELGEHQVFLIKDIFRDRIQPAIMMMVEQMSAVMMMQAQMAGAFLDAQTTGDTMQLFQKMSAEAHRDYHPSVAMCEFGTNVRSLAASQRNAEFGAFALNKRYLDRHLGNTGANAAGGPDQDRGGNANGNVAGRLGEFRKKFCDPNDMNAIPGKARTGLSFCGRGAGNEGLQKGTVNADMDFARTVMLPRVINADFSLTTDPSVNENDTIAAMSSNLYGHDVFKRDKGVFALDKNHDEYMDVRAVIAKRAVAQSTFNNIVALKTRGTRFSETEGSSADTGKFMKMILRGMGQAEDAGNWDEAAMSFPAAASPQDKSFNRYLTGRDHADGEYKGEMSYFAQMEFLAKKLYQRPEFYTNLYDKPANIKRQGVAMQAIGLMLDRDIHDSFLRSEMLLSMILELKLSGEDGIQERVQGNFVNMEERTGPAP